MEVINLTQEDLKRLLEAAAERGAARALKADRQAVKAEYVPRDTAIDMLCVSVRTLRRLVSEGYIKANREEGRRAVYYCRADIEEYISGKRTISKV